MKPIFPGIANHDNIFLRNSSLLPALIEFQDPVLRIENDLISIFFWSGIYIVCLFRKFWMLYKILSYANMNYVDVIIFITYLFRTGFSRKKVEVSIKHPPLHIKCGFNICQIVSSCLSSFPITSKVWNPSIYMWIFWYIPTNTIKLVC